jgi:anti-sigma factor RsiW
MNSCQDLDESLSLFATGALEPGEEARVRAHLDTCATCRREVSALQETLGLAALAAPSPREQAVLATLPQNTVGRWRRTQVRRAERLRTTAAWMVAASVLLFLAGPLRSPQGPAPAPSPPDTALSSSEEDVLAMEQWAMANPLTDALDPMDAAPASALDDPGAWDAESDDFLSSPSLGDAL